MPIIHEDKNALLSAVQEFLSSLPADTRSVQCALFAYDSSYEDYDEKNTKCVSEQDVWFILSENDRMKLLEESVTSTLKKVGLYLSAPADTEEELLQKDELMKDLKVFFKTLARSFSLYLENVDTAAIAIEQLDRLFDGILTYNDRSVFTTAFDLFRKKKNLESQMEELQWKLLSKPRSKAAVKPPIGKTATAAKSVATAATKDAATANAPGATAAKAAPPEAATQDSRGTTA